MIASSLLGSNRCLQNFLTKFQMTWHDHADQFGGQLLSASAQPASPCLVVARHTCLDNYSNPLVFAGAANQGALPFLVQRT